MGSEYMELGPVPSDEACAQVGQPHFMEDAKKEMTAYIHQLERLWPEAYFKIKWFPHDFGMYGEVVVVYMAGGKTEHQAYESEKCLPRTWDDAAKAELELVTK